MEHYFSQKWDGVKKKVSSRNEAGPEPVILPIPAENRQACFFWRVRMAACPLLDSWPKVLS